MKKAFTLVELLIVVVVLVTLMTITLRIGGVGDETQKRNLTTNRMQRLENCLSGYYAAYGSYPPVKLHGNRDYRLPADNYGLQDEDAAPETELKWDYVKAACMSQPVAMCYPFQKDKEDYVRAVSRIRQETATTPNPKNNFEALVDNSMVSAKSGSRKWKDVQIFKFGMLSYLVPRYLVIIGGGESTANVDSQLFDNQQQWTSNNQLPCRFETGVPYERWSDVITDAVRDPWKISALTSQAICARWLPNLEGTVSTTFQRTIYGVNLQNQSAESGNGVWEIYDASANGSQGKGNGGGGQNYALEKMTVVDGWGNDFYYYSLPPHQSYTLWSGGPNGKTFPPWVDLNTLEEKDRKTVQDWIADDFMQMSN